jgi:plasmid maintenance system antidote protein VapI
MLAKEMILRIPSSSDISQQMWMTVYANLMNKVSFFRPIKYQINVLRPD